MKKHKKKSRDSTSTISEVKKETLEEIKMPPEVIIPPTTENFTTNEGIINDKYFCDNLEYFVDSPDEINWKRPSSIVEDPCILENYDKDIEGHYLKGSLSTEWFPLLVMILKRKKMLELIIRNVKQQDNFNLPSYEGCFYFTLFHKNHWRTIVIDDRLPHELITGKALYCTSSNKEEFLPGLLEKAVAKLYNGYNNLKLLDLEDILVNITGGLMETLTLYRHRSITSLTDVIKIYKRIVKLDGESFVICETGDEEIEHTNKTNTTSHLPEHHFYLISGTTQLPASYNSQSALSSVLTNFFNTSTESIELIRLCNPVITGDWNGAFSLASMEWESISDTTKSLYKLVYEHESEFWMAFTDFCCNISRIVICHIPMEKNFLNMINSDKSWYCMFMEGSWSSQHTLNGSFESVGNAFLTNDQYLISNNNYKDCDLMVSVFVQKKSSNVPDKIGCGLTIFKVENNRLYRLHSISNCGVPLECELLSNTTNTYTIRIRITLGCYVILPWKNQNIENEEILYYFRVYSKPKSVEVRLLTEDLPEFKICGKCSFVNSVTSVKNKLFNTSQVEMESNRTISSYDNTVCTMCIAKNPQIATRITIVEVNNVDSITKKGSPNSYLIVQFNNYRYRLETKINTKNPIWNESFIFFRCSPNIDSITIELYSEENMAFDKFLGQLILTNKEMSKNDYKINFTIPMKNEIVKTSSEIMLKFNNYNPLQFDMI